MRSISVVTLALLTMQLMPGGSRLYAQDEAPPAHVMLTSGLFQFELSGNGLAPMVAARAALPISNVLLIEGSLMAARPGQHFVETTTTTFVVPEAQVQLTLPFTTILPYMGLGVGAALDLRNGSAGGLKSSMTVSGSVGVKSWVRSHLGIQAEYRGRGVGFDFAGTSSEYTVGLLWRV